MRAVPSDPKDEDALPCTTRIRLWRWKRTKEYWIEISASSCSASGHLIRCASILMFQLLLTGALLNSQLSFCKDRSCIQWTASQFSIVPYTNVSLPPPPPTPLIPFKASLHSAPSPRTCTYHTPVKIARKTTARVKVFLFSSHMLNPSSLPTPITLLFLQVAVPKEVGGADHPNHWVCPVQAVASRPCWPYSTVS